MADVVEYAWTGTANLSPSVQRVNGVVTRTNLVTNPGFEVGTADWGAEANVTVTRVTTGQASGVGAAQVVKNVATASSTGFRYTKSGLTVGATYTMSASVKSVQGHPIVSWTNQSVQGPAFTTTDSWQRVTYTFVATTATGQNLFLIMNSGAGSSGDGYLIDEVLLEAGSTAGMYFDGSAVSGTTYAWKGTANASPSVQRVGTLTRTNLITNPGPGGSGGTTTGWMQSAGTGGTTTLSVVHDGSEPASARGFVRVKWTTAQTAVGGSTYWTGLPVTVGTTYTFSGYVRYSQAQRLRARIAWQDTTGTIITTADSAVFDQPPNYSWNRLSVTATAPANAVTATVYIYITTGGNGSLMASGAFGDLTAWLFEASSTLGDYFDGSFPWSLNGWTANTGTTTSTQAGLPELLAATNGTTDGHSTADTALELIAAATSSSDAQVSAWGVKPRVFTIQLPNLEVTVA
ncbi:hypothetical protein DEI93_07150 [Curtobacterium sp. MCBD17_035]|uniref:phage head spike fiber domain-containing protein n=1 Tax=Curtobacterium sp. MCBD17_035 TaxID=2175673 RepID=UPI0011B51BDB|nr:hypothetical protein [Curtobacterium sp. MCBD17_035]WIB68798.1 hypothetical protein DEI93_07150 [Curtobacterium sp. MCBD17_035]